MPFPDSAFGRATPGPWHANANCIEAAGPEGPRDVTVAVVTGYPKGDSNARLIAAAPGLLAACREAVSAITYLLSNDDDDPNYADTLSKLAAAIDQAEGRGE